MPIAFLGHGSPMNALLAQPLYRGLADLRRVSPAARANLAISAHWYTNATAVTAMPRSPSLLAATQSQGQDRVNQDRRGEHSDDGEPAQLSERRHDEQSSLCV